jgi:hypothetical protein
MARHAPEPVAGIDRNTHIAEVNLGFIVSVKSGPQY